MFSRLCALVLFCTLVFALPARAQSDGSGFVDVNGARIFYTSTGSGVPLVLIHGYPLSGDLFTLQRPALTGVFRVITIDLRGFGRSIAPDSTASVELYASDVIAVMDALGISSAVVGGHSLGGMISLNLYSRIPQRVLGLVLLDTTAAPPPIVEQMMWRGYAEQAVAGGVESLLPLQLPEMFTGKARVERPGYLAALATIIRQASLNGLVGGATALAERPDLRPILPTIAVPTLVAVGREDSLTPLEVSQSMEAAIPNAALVVVPDASHAAVAERADVINAAILAAARGTLQLMR